MVNYAVEKEKRPVHDGTWSLHAPRRTPGVTQGLS
jgi:hypothetical protein